MSQPNIRGDESIRAPSRVGGHSLTSAEKRKIDFSGKIPGWGSDLDRSLRPGVPMDKAPEIGREQLYPPFEAQVPRGKVHKSTEHGQLPPVFGNVCPPRGLSGLIRNSAYRLSEGRLSHWMLLMLADRVDAVEEVVIDLAHIRGPNVFKEIGLKAELKYNRKGFAKKAALLGLGMLSFVAFANFRKPFL